MQKEDESRPDPARSVDAFERFLEESSVDPDLETVVLGGGTGGDPHAPQAKGVKSGAGAKLGRFTLVEKLGEGGFGEVWRATQEKPVRREVALKVLKASVAGSGDMIARFRAEGQALALMDHPNVAKVYDAGELAGGRFYFAMELVGSTDRGGAFVPGVALTDYCDGRQLGLKERMALFAQVCRAIHHAHQKGVIHRDIKPSNLLVTESDGKAVPKVIDFGIAKDTGAHLLQDTLYTETGQLIGTPQYMSPEQASGIPGAVDTRTDVYALGAVLYELLCGEPPISRETVRSASLEELLRMIREVEPPRPSARAGSSGAAVTATARGLSEARRLSERLKGEADWITLRAMEKEPGRRHQSVGDLAEDAEAFVADEPLPHSGPPSRGYRLKKFVRRYRATVRAAAAILIVLMLGITVSLWQAARALDARNEANAQRDAAFYNEGLGWILRAEVAEERGNRYPDTLLYAARAIGFDGFGITTGIPDPDLPPLITQERDPQVYESVRSWIRERPNYLPVWSSELRADAASTGLSIDPTGRWIALGAVDGSVRLWDLASGAEIEVSPPNSVPVRDVAFHPDGNSLVWTDGEQVQFWNLSEKMLAQSRAEPVAVLAFSPDGEILAGAKAEGPILLWDSAEADPKEIPTGQSVAAETLAFSPDNSSVAAVFPGGGIRVYFHIAGEPHGSWSEHDGEFSTLAFSPDGLRLAAGSASGMVSLWDVASARLIGEAVPPEWHKGAVSDLSFRPDGGQLASASADGTIKLWDPGGDVPQLVATLTGHRSTVNSVAYAPGGILLASAGADGSTKLWDVSGKIGSEPDLYAYLGADWYQFDSETQELGWNAGKGFLKLPPDSLAGIWRAGGNGLFARLLETGSWGGAVLVSQGEDRKSVAETLVKDAVAAADDSRWHRVRLRLKQLEKLGVSEEKITDMEKKVAAVGADGKDFMNGDEIELVWCPPGTFVMGMRGSNDASDRPHEVTLTSGFWIGKYEVTQGQYEAVMGVNPSSNINDPKSTLR